MYDRTCIQFSDDYLELFSVILSCKWVKDEHSNVRYVNVYWLDQLLLLSYFWDRMIGLRLTRTLCQGAHPSITSFLNHVPTGTYNLSTPLPFGWDVHPREADKVVWKLFTSRKFRHAGLNAMIQGLTNVLLDEHKEAGLPAFPGSGYLFNLYLSRTVEPHASSQDFQDFSVREYVVPHDHQSISYRCTSLLYEA